MTLTDANPAQVQVNRHRVGHGSPPSLSCRNRLSLEGSGLSQSDSSWQIRRSSERSARSLLWSAE